MDIGTESQTAGTSSTSVGAPSNPVIRRKRRPHPARRARRVTAAAAVGSVAVMTGIMTANAATSSASAAPHSGTVVGSAAARTVAAPAAKNLAVQPARPAPRSNSASHGS